MVTTGIHCEGLLEYPLQELPSGMVMPDVSMDELRRRGQAALRTQIELGVHAEEAGYDYVVYPERHFELFFRASPDPVLAQMAVAAQTDDIRLLQVANSLTRHDPVRLAERTAALDAVSEGRVDVGIMSDTDQLADPLFESTDDPDTAFVEYAELLAAAWGEQPLSYDGETYQVPPESIPWDRDATIQYLNQESSGARAESFVDFGGSEPTLRGYPVTPQPTQEPHPQRWRTTDTPENAAWAARRGMNVVTYARTVSQVAELVETYYEAAEKAGWPDRRPAYDGEPFAYGWDDDRRRGVVAEVQLFDTDASGESGLEEWRRGTELMMSLEKSRLPPEQAQRYPVDADARLAGSEIPIVGGSTEIAARLTELADVCGYEEFAVIPNITTPGMSRDTRIEQLEAFASDVVPQIER